MLFNVHFFFLNGIATSIGVGGYYDVKCNVALLPSSSKLCCESLVEVRSPSSPLILPLFLALYFCRIYMPVAIDGTGFDLDDRLGECLFPCAPRCVQKTGVLKKNIMRNEA